ncbi:DUF1624 domain-containing protein [Candidatus Micrarchaeota archaeon]|nr:DUF1624 domain-containing protein [Candidatus Micrarchaeota archaeon]
MEKEKRIIEIDIARGIAIVLMIIYHFIFDLNYFGIVQVNLQNIFLVVFQRIIGVSFLTIVGISMTISENRNKEGYTHHLKRGLLLGGVALLITAVTWIYPHDGFIKFGIIHLIALSTIIAPFFFKFGKWNVLFGLVLVGLGLITSGIYVSTPYLFWLGLTSPDYTALDHYPLLPWFGIVLIGIYLGQEIRRREIFKKSTRTNFSKNLSALEFANSNIIKNRMLETFGKNSLAIYLVHQLILVGIVLIYLNLVAT